MFLTALILFVFFSATLAEPSPEELAAQLKELRRVVAELQASGAKQNALFRHTLNTVTRQVMMQQLFVEERIRTDGHSGIKRVRHRTEGTQPYYAESHTGNSVASLHDHANLVNTAGLGEFVAVINGVEFRTRHNDYKLVMPHRTAHGGTKKGFHKTEPIPFPPVPPAVLEKGDNVTAQALELREWFKAWRDSDHKTRDYRPYFRPVLCYLEGAWMADTGKLDESFESDRHHLDADSWFEMQEKIRFTSYSGRKSTLENFAFLPTTIIGTVDRFNLSIPVMAQWNYRILCHPVKAEVPLTLLRPVDDFGNRMAFLRKFEHVHNSRATRYQINPNNQTYFRESRARFGGIMDKLMMEIPGKDNYLGNAVDDAFDTPATHVMEDRPINAAYYNRNFRVNKRGAMGLSTRHRGFSDENLFAALTNSTKVAPMNVTDCVGRGKQRKCTTYSQRWSWAVPLELIYLTPLQSWNPFNLTFHGFTNQAKSKVTANNRNGGLTKEKAFNGIAQTFFYLTPEAFFETAKDSGKDKADTGAGTKGVLDPQGEVQRVVNSGIKTVLPPIPGIGRMRIRYPIVPLHEEGTTAYKETAALKELIMEPRHYANMLRHPGKGVNGTDGALVRLRLGSQGTHSHDVMLTAEEVADLRQGKLVEVWSEEENTHSHHVQLRFDYARQKFYLRMCDGQRGRCPDGHKGELVEIKDE